MMCVCVCVCVFVLVCVRGSISHAEGFNVDADDMSNSGSKGHHEDTGTHRSAAEDSRLVM
jgi:hypothetical protein